MNEVVQLNPKPKQESYNYEGQRYILKFEPNAPPGQRWSWCVVYTRSFQYFGSASDINTATNQAKARIRKLVRRGEVDVR